jgi:thiamine-monophosphate kinase
LALQRGHTADDPLFAPAIARFLRPTARLALATQVAECAHACIDVSDGLAQDLSHVSRASQVSIVLDLDALPLISGLHSGAARLGADVQQLILGGGEEYELLFTATAEGVPSELATPIGRVLAGPAELRIFDGKGQPIPLPRGFDHFR